MRPTPLTPLGLYKISSNCLPVPRSTKSKLSPELLFLNAKSSRDQGHVTQSSEALSPAVGREREGSFPIPREFVRTTDSGAGEIAQRLSTRTALAEDPSFIPSTCKGGSRLYTTCNSNSRVSNALVWAPMSSGARVYAAIPEKQACH